MRGSRPAHDCRPTFGPFHRRFADKVQDTETLVLQLRSGEIWGRTARFGAPPAVKAFAGPLEPNAKGIEFWTFQEPSEPHGPRVYWRRIGPYLRADKRAEVVRLKVAFVRVTQDLHDPHEIPGRPLEATGDRDQG